MVLHDFATNLTCMYVSISCCCRVVFVYFYSVGFDLCFTSSSFRGGAPRLQMASPKLLGTWLSPDLPAGVLQARYCFLIAMLSGLSHKSLIKFAWDVQEFTRHLNKVFRASTRVHGDVRIYLMGSTAILLRQIFAAVGQGIVSEMAVKLAGKSRSWSIVSLRCLVRELQKCEPVHVGKRKGRMAQYTGPLWVQDLIEDNTKLTAFTKASWLLGEFLTSVAQEDQAFRLLCRNLRAKKGCKLHSLDGYSVPHLVRACCVAREHIHGHGAAIEPDAKAWDHDLRVMHADRTARIFALLGVHDYADARDMISTVLGMVRHCYSYRTGARFSTLSLIDLPCQACEFAGILTSVKAHMKAHVTRGRGAEISDAKALTWLLQRLPSQVSECVELGRQLRRDINMSSDRGNGLDKQCSGNVASRWLQAHGEGLRPALPHHALEVLTCGRGDILGVPQLRCPDCASQLFFRATTGRRRIRCDACISANRREYHRKRKATSQH